MSMDNRFFRAVSKLVEEKKKFRADHPPGFEAKVLRNSDGSLNVKIWDCTIPGKIGTRWEGKSYTLRLMFSDRYPIEPPKCQFNPPIFHPNVGRSGMMNIPVLKENMDWSPSLTVKDILIEVQHSLDEPCMNYAVNDEAYDLYKNARQEYYRKVKDYAKNCQ